MDKENLTLPKLLRPAELSDHLGVPKPTIYSWVRRGDIPFVKLGGLVRFDPGEIHDWLKERKHPARKKLLFLRDPDISFFHKMTNSSCRRIGFNRGLIV